MFLDRDGVINRALVRGGRPYPPRSLEELEVSPEVPAAVARLRQAGFLTFMVTNQPDIARGTTTWEDVDTLNDAIAAVVEFDDIVVCPHDDADGCKCRKPEPGMLLDTAQKFGVGLTRSFMVGDRWRDIEAGHRAECRSVFIERDYDEPSPANPDVVVDNLSAAADWILRLESLHRSS